MAVSFNDLVKQCLKSEKITVQKTFCIALVKDGTNTVSYTHLTLPTT